MHTYCISFIDSLNIEEFGLPLGVTGNGVYLHTYQLFFCSDNNFIVEMKFHVKNDIRVHFSFTITFYKTVELYHYNLPLMVLVWGSVCTLIIDSFMVTNAWSRWKDILRMDIEVCDTCYARWNRLSNPRTTNIRQKIIHP